MSFDFVYFLDGKGKQEFCDYCGKTAACHSKGIYYCEEHFKQTDAYRLFAKLKKLEMRDNLRQVCTLN